MDTERRHGPSTVSADIQLLAGCNIVPSVKLHVYVVTEITSQFNTVSQWHLCRWLCSENPTGQGSILTYKYFRYSFCTQVQFTLTPIRWHSVVVLVTTSVSVYLCHFISFNNRVAIWWWAYSKLFDNSFKGNRRQFWKYIRAKRQDKPDIPALLVNSHPIHSAKGKANALNNHFKSVFTKENLSSIPIMDNHIDIANMPDVSIPEAGIYQLLTTLDEHKAGWYHPTF